VARPLAQYPLIRGEFAAARLSYAKVRALTRIVTPETEADLVEMATPMTPAQLERFAQAHRRVSEADNVRPRPARRLAWNRVGDLDYQFRATLPHDSRDHDSQDHDQAESEASFSAKTPPPAELESTEDLADALVQICARYLGAKASAADNPDTHQVIIHAGTRAVTGAEPADVSAETLPL
jgi:hypothetical protein